MHDIQNQIEEVRKAFFQALESVHDTKMLDELRIEFLGRKGKIAELMAQFKSLSEDERRTNGPLVQSMRKELEEAFLASEKKFSSTFARASTQMDVSLSLYEPLVGKKHIYSQVIEELENIFLTMGYTIADGNEVETEYYNFSALNIPADHPARALMDTFFLTKPNGMLLRTHTSSVQARIMEKQRPPIALFSTGRVYRNEETDQTHDFMFMQAECMFIDTDVSVSNLLATAQKFLRAIFKNDALAMRVRPGYFPFVEPGLEIDVECPFCTAGCSACKKTRWIELLGSGLIHPNVLRMSGIDPAIYSGFALGMGIERLIMLRQGIPDVRLFHSNKIAFLDQF